MSWDVIDLSQLPAPDIVEELDFETILKKWVAKFTELAPELAASLLESDPAMRNMQTGSYRDLLLRQRINEACKAVMLAYATGTTLEHVAATRGVKKLMLDAGDPDALPPIEPTYEDDESLRRRAQMAPEGYSTAGPDGAYIFHALNAHGDVRDASVDAPRFDLADVSESVMALLPPKAIVLIPTYDAGLEKPKPGDVVVHILSHKNDGIPSKEVLDAVDENLNDEEIVPLTDNPKSRAAKVHEYEIIADIIFFPGPSSKTALDAVEASAKAYTEEMYKLEYDIMLPVLSASMVKPGVQNVILHSPPENIICKKGEAARCTGITIRNGGTDV